MLNIVVWNKEMEGVWKFICNVSIQVFKVIASPQFRKLFIRGASYRKRKKDG